MGKLEQDPETVGAKERKPSVDIDAANGKILLPVKWKKKADQKLCIPTLSGKQTHSKRKRDNRRMSIEKEEVAVIPRRKLLCTASFDALWFCYSPVHQMQQYYRLGSLGNCSGKWNAIVDCLKLKTKRSIEV